MITNKYSWFNIFKSFRAYEGSILDVINSRRFSRYSQLKSRVFDRYQINALCYNEFYGLERIKYDRENYRSFLQYKKHSKKFLVLRKNDIK